jgi:hypothetical protein
LVVAPRWPPECPSCKSRNLEQLISAFVVNSEATAKASVAEARKQAERSICEEKVGTLDEFRGHH